MFRISESRSDIQQNRGKSWGQGGLGLQLDAHVKTNAQIKFLYYPQFELTKLKRSKIAGDSMAGFDLL